MRKMSYLFPVNFVTLRKHETVATLRLPFLPVNNDAIIIDGLPYVVSFCEWRIENGQLDDVTVKLGKLDIESVLEAAGLPF